MGWGGIWSRIENTTKSLQALVEEMFHCKKFNFKICIMKCFSQLEIFQVQDLYNEA